MDNLRGLLGIRRMDRVLNARIRELCGVRKGLDEILESRGEEKIVYFSSASPIPQKETGRNHPG